jgi:hypothetical protein
MILLRSAMVAVSGLAQLLFCLLLCAPTLLMQVLNYPEIFTHNTALDPDPTLTGSEVLSTILRLSALCLVISVVVAGLIYALNLAMWEDERRYKPRLIASVMAALTFLMFASLIVWTGIDGYLEYGARLP